MSGAAGVTEVTGTFQKWARPSPPLAAANSVPSGEKRTA